MQIRRIIAVVFLLICFYVSRSQDTLYRVDGKVTPCKITKVTNKVVDFLPWDNLDGAEHEISRAKVAYIVYQGGKVQAISDTSVKTTYVPNAPTTSNTGAKTAPANTTPDNNARVTDKSVKAAAAASQAPSAPPRLLDCKQCDPTERFEKDASVQLCGFKSAKDAHYKGQKQNRLYVNDPDKKFVASKQLICLGIDFSFMKLISSHDQDNAADLKAKDMAHLANFMNDDPGMYFLNDKFGQGKKVKPEMNQLKGSWKNLDDKNWIISDDEDYNIAPGKIPAIIKSYAFTQTQGLGAIFLLEKLNKPGHSVSGYWVIFDFADKKTLVIDHLVYNDVTPQTAESGWWLFWKGALNDAQVWHPFDIEKYYDLEKKGAFEKSCE